MNTFSLAFFIAVGLIVLAVWVLLYVDIVGPGLGRVVARIVGRTRDRGLRAAAKRWGARTETSFTRQRDLLEAALAPMRHRRFARGGYVQPERPGDVLLTQSPELPPYMWVWTCRRRRCRFTITSDLRSPPTSEAYLKSIRDHLRTHR